MGKILSEYQDAEQIKRLNGSEKDYLVCQKS